MRVTNATVNLRPINVVQFDTLSEALKTLPESLILSWINTVYRNNQMVLFSDALRDASRGK
jgi:hypothetical protein